MASKKVQATLRGRFRPGTKVKLVEVEGAHVLRPPGDARVVGEKTVDDDGVVQFASGVKDGGYYFAVGQRDGEPLAVRLRGAEVGRGASHVAHQAPVAPDVVARRGRTGQGDPTGLRLAQEQVGDGVQQRAVSVTGTAHPVDPDERGPYPDQESEEFSAGKVEQRSDTPLGMATPIHEKLSQDEIGDKVAQRSNTPLGVAAPVAEGDPVDAARAVESAVARAAAGESTQAEALGAHGEKVATGGSRHEDAVAEPYVPVGPGKDPGEQVGHPQQTKRPARKRSR